MLSCEIEVDDTEIIKQINKVLDDVLWHEIRGKFSDSTTRTVIALAVEELVNSHQDEIFDLIAEKTSKTLISNGLPELIKRIKKRYEEELKNEIH